MGVWIRVRKTVRVRMKVRVRVRMRVRVRAYFPVKGGSVAISGF